MPRISVYRKTPGNLTPGALRFFMKLRSSLIQTLLSVLEFHQISRQSGSRTIPPVGNFDFQGFRSPCPEEIFFSWWIIQ